MRVYATPLTETQVLALANRRGAGSGMGQGSGGSSGIVGPGQGGGPGNVGGPGQSGGPGGVGGPGNGHGSGGGSENVGGSGNGRAIDCGGLALYFPFDTNLKDISCNRAGWHKVGLGNIDIVDDADRGKVARFDGQTALEVGSLVHTVDDAVVFMLN